MAKEENGKISEKKVKPSVRKPLFGRILGSKEKEYLLESLTMMLQSGMNILSALEAIRDEIRSKSMREVIDEIVSDIDAGSNLWKALSRARLFPNSDISLIKIGEESGRLPENLQVVANQQQKNRVFKTKLRSAMLYPTFVLFLTIVIGIGIAWFILPKLSSVFASLRIDLPLITRFLISVGEFLEKRGAFVVPILLILLAVSIFIVFFYDKTKHIGQNLLIRFPGINTLIVQIELARFGFVFGTLLKAGLPMIRAIDSLIESSNIRKYQEFYSYLYKSIEEGNSFQKSFKNYPDIRRIIPVPIQQMLIAGEKSGRMPETLMKVGENFEVKVDVTTKSLAVILEPIMLIIVWLGVVFVALAVIMPIYSLIGQL